MYFSFFSFSVGIVLMIGLAVGCGGDFPLILKPRGMFRERLGCADKSQTTDSCTPIDAFVTSSDHEFNRFVALLFG